MMKYPVRKEFMDRDISPFISIGDVVHLNSGSPNMTVTKVEIGRVKVTWIVNGAVQEGEFPTVCLTKIK